MPETIAVVIFVVLVGSLIFQYFNNRNTSRELQEYKQLFELADASQREGQAKVERLLEETGRKNVLMERGSQALEGAQVQMSAYVSERTKNVEEIDGLKSSLVFQEEQYSKLFSQKKSSEVRTGKITEQISPFLNDYPLNSATARFIGDPIDFVHFDEDKVSFVEVKSGKSQLSKKQRHIRDLIKEGKVEFILYRVEGK